MADERPEEMSRERLISELKELRASTHGLTAGADEQERERLVHDLSTRQVKLEMQYRDLMETRNRLEETTARYSDLYELAPVGYCTLDPEGRIREINLTGAALLGAPREQLVGRLFTAVASLREKAPFLAHLRRCGQERARVIGEVVLRPRAPEGARTLQLVSDPIRDERGETTAYRTALVEISEIKALENRLRVLAEAGARLASSLDGAAVLETAAESVVPALADVCVIDLASESGAGERPLVRFADPRKQAGVAGLLEDSVPKRGWKPPHDQVIDSGEPMLMAEVSPEQRARLAHDPRGMAVLAAAGIRSVMVIPLTARGRTLGALTLATAESDRRYGTTDLGVAQELAGRVAVALDNARLYAEAQRMNRTLLAGAKAAGIVSISPDAIISVDDAQRITLWNEGAEKIYGYSSAEAIGAPLDMLVPERVRAAHRRAVAAFAAGPEIARRIDQRNVELVGLRKNGEEFPADAAVSKLEVGGERVLTVSLRDVTEQKRIEAEQRFLAETGKVLASGLDYEHTLTDVVKLVARDLADYAMLYVREENGRIRRARAAARDPLPSGHDQGLIVAEESVGPRHAAAGVIATRQSLLAEVTPSLLESLASDEAYERALQAAHLRSVMGVPLLAGDACFGALFFKSKSRLFGVEDLRLAEEVGRRMGLLIENARLHRAAKTAIQTRDELLGVVAHDLRNPLAAISFEAKLLEKLDPGMPDKVREGVKLIDTATSRMDRLIHDLLDAARLDAGPLELDPAPLVVAEVVSEFVRTEKPLAESSGLALETELSPDAGKVSADRDRLFQVLENLVGNALKFTKRGGRVTVGAAPRDGEVWFWVADTGAGIAEDEVEHLFDRSRRVSSRQGGGLGLGLRIVKGIVDAHHGRLWVESRLGSGSKFCFTMPRPAEVAAGPTGEPAHAGARDQAASGPEPDRPPTGPARRRRRSVDGAGRRSGSA